MTQRQEVTAHAPRRPEIDYRINIAAIVSWFILGAGGVWWVAALQGDVASHERRIAAIEKAGVELQQDLAALTTEVAVVRTLVSGQGEVLRRVEKQLDAILDSLRRSPAP